MRVPFVIALFVVGIGSLTFAEIERSLPAPLPADIESYHDRWVMDWHGCPYGSCRPAFHPVPDGGYRFLSCTNGWCGLRMYTYWTDESCNVLITCPYYPEHRND